MNDFELLLSGMPAFEARIRELRNVVLLEGPLDVRSRTLVFLAASLTMGHPALNEVLIWAKQQGVRNDEISHVAAISAILRATHWGPSNGTGRQAPDEPQSAGCC